MASAGVRAEPQTFLLSILTCPASCHPVFSKGSSLHGEGEGTPSYGGAPSKGLWVTPPLGCLLTQ